MTEQLHVLAVGGPTALLEIGGLRLVTDPTFDEPGEYVSGSGSVLTKTAPAARTAAQLAPVDAVLLSHDLHPDNLDRAGRAFLADVPLVLTTESGAGRLGGTARALPTWAHHDLPRPDGGVLRVTAVPAEHGPEGAAAVVGEVTGFLLTGDGLPTTYVSGDNASLALVDQIAARFGPVHTAVLFAGAARTAVLGGALLTLDSAQAVHAARTLDAQRVVVLHCNSWAHFTEGADQVRAAFASSEFADRLVLLQPGESTTR